MPESRRVTGCGSGCSWHQGVCFHVVAMSQAAVLRPHRASSQAPRHPDRQQGLRWPWHVLLPSFKKRVTRECRKAVESRAPRSARGLDGHGEVPQTSPMLVSSRMQMHVCTRTCTHARIRRRCHWS